MRATFGIVGGGFTGTMLAVHLIEQSQVPVRILLFDIEAAFGIGVAY
ncbi:MAG: FAD/NAD(P)-binding protein, partial [Rhodospirillales bacterium]|nr:FAD/NAD(P)-binding protein [Rhodospirillales bacterium]